MSIIGLKNEIREYNNEYQRGKIEKGLKILDGITKHFYIFHKVIEDKGGEFKRKLFYQIPYSEWTLNKEFQNILKEYFQNTDFKNENEFWRYLLSEDEEFDKINSILENEDKINIEFEKLQIFYKLFDRDENEENYTNSSLQENISNNLKKFLFLDARPLDYSELLFNLEQKLFDGLMIKETIFLPLYYNQIWFGFLIISSDQAKTELIKNKIYFFIPSIQEKLYKLIFEKRFLKNPILDIDNWSIDQVSRIASTIGLTTFEYNRKNKELKFKKHQRETEKLKTISKIIIKNQPHSILIPETKEKMIKPIIISSLNDTIENARLVNELRRSYIKTAIAAIMARNMSHNIGSHILSTLGYEGMSAADDKILFKYLQQRMDYIAQISSEIPKWTQSTWFLNDLMKRFFKQKNILKYLGHSEGLTAYFYKNENTDDKTPIEIKVNKKNRKEWGNSENIIPGSNTDDNSRKLKDFQLAIPGGVVGCHAFYTILENFIRNAAKHDWGKGDKKEIKSLKITIEFEDNPKKNYIPFAIYYDIPKSEEEINKLIDEVLNAAFRDNLIKANGELHRENWGLGEIRISAGYLLKKDYSEIGLGGETILFEEEDNNTLSGIIKAASIDSLDNGGKKYLGYCFAIPKPKELLFIGDWSDVKKDVKEAAGSFGIHFSDQIFNENQMPHERDFNFIIFEGKKFTQELTNFKRDVKRNDSNDKSIIIDYLEYFPARVFVIWEEGDSENTEDNYKEIFENEDSILRKKAVSIVGKSGILGELTKDKIEEKEFENLFEKIKISIYKKWIDNLTEMTKLNIHIDLEGTGTKKEDEWEKKVFKYIIDNQLENITENIHYKSVKDAKVEFSKQKTELLNIIEELVINKAKMKNRKEIYDYFKRNLSKEIANKDFKILNTNDKSYIQINPIDEYNSNFNAYLESVMEIIFTITKDLIYKEEEDIETLPPILKDQKSINPDFSKIVKEINSYSSDSGGVLELEVSDSEDSGDIIYKRHASRFLGKDQKRYCEALSGSQNFFGILCTYFKESEKKSQNILLQLIENALLHITIIDERIRDFYMKRFRDEVDKFKSAKISIPLGVVFTTNSKSNNDEEKYRVGFALKSEYQKIFKETLKEKESEEGLLEDEKVKIKDNYRSKIKSPGIYFVEETPIADTNKYELEFSRLETIGKRIDILVIHQGILDKMVFKKEDDKNEQSEQREFLNSIKENIPFVFITSGRGEPMSPDTKFIPFSSIETTLMKDYPEKNLLIQALLQVFREKK